MRHLLAPERGIRAVWLRHLVVSRGTAMQPLGWTTLHTRSQGMLLPHLPQLRTLLGPWPSPNLCHSSSRSQGVDLLEPLPSSPHPISLAVPP
jgi:hypothetical protein